VAQCAMDCTNCVYKRHISIFHIPEISFGRPIRARNVCTEML